MDKNENIYNNEMENVKFVGRSYINAYFQNNDNCACLKYRPKNPIYFY